MSGDGSRPRLPASGLAEELLPLLRGERPAPAPTPIPTPALRSTGFLSFLDQVQDQRSFVTAEPEPIHRLITFFVAESECAVAIEGVREILRLGEITTVPRAPSWIRGVMNVRGGLLPLVELRTCLGLPPLERTPQARVIAVEFHGRRLGLMSDRAGRVLSLPASRLVEPRPIDHSPLPLEWIAAIAEHERTSVPVLDLDRLLDREP